MILRVRKWTTENFMFGQKYLILQCHMLFNIVLITIDYHLMHIARAAISNFSMWLHYFTIIRLSGPCKLIV